MKSPHIQTPISSAARILARAADFGVRTEAA